MLFSSLADSEKNNKVTNERILLQGVGSSFACTHTPSMTYIQSKKVSVGLRAADSHSYILKSKCANVNKTHTQS